MRNITILLMISLLAACGKDSKSIDEIKATYGDFGNGTIKYLSIDYTKTPINKAVEHHPEEYTYLDAVDIFSIGHMSDGLFVTGLMVAPKKKGRYPVIVFNRGGNRDLGILLVSVAVNELAPLAAQGYVVVATNYRGNSRGEGVEEFGGSDLNDVSNLIKSMEEIEFADASRVGLLGMSRGSMMNFLTLKTHSNQTIKAVANIGSITDLGTTIKYHPQIEDVAIELIPNFGTNRNEEIEKRSAVYWTDQLPKSTPLLLMHGMSDPHVSYSQMAPFVDSLDVHEIPYKLISFENADHGINSHRMLVRNLIHDWFDRYLKNGYEFNEETKRVTIE